VLKVINVWRSNDEGKGKGAKGKGAKKSEIE
jgi:hypothetical protein